MWGDMMGWSGKASQTVKQEGGRMPTGGGKRTPQAERADTGRASREELQGVQVELRGQTPAIGKGRHALS